MYVVTKPFKTVNRRFRVGDEISAADLDGPMTAEDWAARGFLRGIAPQSVPPAPVIEPDDDDPPN